MNFVCSKEILVKELIAASKIVVAKSSITTISNVILNLNQQSLTLKATDAKIWFETQIAVDGVTDGEIAINCDKFLNIVRSLPSGEISCTADNGHLVIKSLAKVSIEFSLRYHNAEGFPEMPFTTNENFFRLSQADFLKMAKQTSFAVSKEETRVFVNGVYLEYKDNALIEVATDAKRLALIKLPTETAIPEFEGVIMPPKFLDLVKNLACGEGEIALAIVDKTLCAMFDNLKISAVLIEGRFPNYSKVIPEQLTHQVTFGTADFTDALKRVALMTDPRLNRIFITFNGEGAVLKSVSTEEGEAREEVAGTYTLLDSAYNGANLAESNITLALNCQFISEPLAVIGDKEFSFRFNNDTSRPIMLYPVQTEDFFHVIMPMQVD